jgi:fatty-acyl-CoA synthase
VRKPDAKWGEVPVAFVVRRDSNLEAAHIDEMCRARLASYKRPKAVHFIAADAVPRNATGKIVREQLEALARQLS